MALKKTLIVIWATAMAFSLFSCGGYSQDSPVVKVTEVSGESALRELDEEASAKLEEIKRSKETQKLVDLSVENVIQETPHMTVPEYLQVNPESRAEILDYTVGGYDVIAITVYEEKDLSREAVRVSGEGFISFPLVGKLEVGGLTTSGIEELISRRLAEEQYLLDAHVSVMVTQFNSKRFLVLGAVESPGSYPLQAREKVLDGVSRAGGIQDENAGHRAMVIRTHDASGRDERKVVIDIPLGDLLQRGDQMANIPLADQDVLYVPTAEHFYIMGEVNQPGSYPIPDKEITLVEAIGAAGGFTPIAAGRNARIIRVENGVEKVIEVNVDAITKAGRKIQDVVIKPNDLIIVPESFF